MIFMNQWNSYMWPLLVARSKDIRTIQIAISQFSGERSIQWTYIYASSMVSAIIPICLFLPFQKRERIDNYEENISNRKPQPGYGRECRPYAGNRRDNLKQ